MIFIIGIIAVIVIAALAFFLTYTVVNPNEAHIVVIMGSGRKTYTPSTRDEEKKSTAYFFIPFLMRRAILPLANVKMEIPKFELKDEQVAPFVCEVTCWFRIEHPDIAVEKLDMREDDFEDSVRGTLEEQVRGIARAAAMKQEILEIMRDRKTFGDVVQTEVNGALEEWGLELVKLEIVDFSDPEGSSIIRDYEKMREAEVKANSRKKIAAQNKDAEVVEAKNTKEAGVAKAESERDIQKANVDKEKQVRVATQEAQKAIAIKTKDANEQKINAQRETDVGVANVEREAMVARADGEAESKLKVGQAEADINEAKGNAEAVVIRNKGLSEAEAKEKLAEALKKYNDAGIVLEQIKAWIQVQKSKYENLGRALEKAHLNANVVSSGDETSSLFGFDLGPEGGAGLAQMLKAFEKTSGISISDIAKNVVGKKKEAQAKKQ